MRCLIPMILLLALSLGYAPAAAEEADTSEPVAATGKSASPRNSASRSSRSLELATTSVTGNRELPKVMVIVPWKNAEPADLGGRPLASLVEAALSPIDRDVFRRELAYYALLHGDDASDREQSDISANNRD